MKLWQWIQRDMQFGVYWPRWYKLWPWWRHWPADEDGPAELTCGFGPFQVRTYRWRK